jgi:uncharacterized membrane protein YesL
MGLFDRLYAPDRPDVPSDAPRKTGLALFFSILGREWWELLKLNIVFVLMSLAIVTIPAAQAGATRVAVDLVEDRNSYLGRDFMETFRSEFWRASLGGWLILAGQAVALYALYVYAQALAGSPAFAVPVVVSAAVFLVLTLTGFHFYPLLVETDLPLKLVLKNALFLAILNLPYGAAAFAVCLALWVVHVVAYPVSVFMPAVMNFSLATFVATFAAQRAIRRYVLRQEGNT